MESGLAHVVGGVEGVYNKAAYLEDRVRMMQWWADYLDDLRGGQIVEFPKVMA